MNTLITLFFISTIPFSWTQTGIDGGGGSSGGLSGKTMNSYLQQNHIDFQEMKLPTTYTIEGKHVLIFDPYNSSLSNIEFVDNGQLDIEQIRDILQDGNEWPTVISLPIDQIKSISLYSGKVLDTDNLWNIEKFVGNETPLDFNEMNEAGRTLDFDNAVNVYSHFIRSNPVLINEENFKVREDGWEIYIDNFENLRKLMIKPESLSLDEYLLD